MTDCLNNITCGLLYIYIIYSTYVSDIIIFDDAYQVFNRISEDGSDDELQTPKEVSTADVVAEAKKEVEEEADAKAELDEEFKDADKVLYHTLQDLLTSHHLGGFALNFFNHGIDTLDSLKGCTDQFLAEQIGMKKAHVLKFRRALKYAHVDSLSSFHTIYEAPDGMMCVRCVNNREWIPIANFDFLAYYCILFQASVAHMMRCSSTKKS